MKIHINYTYDFTPKVKRQLEEAVDWLCEVLVSDEFKWKSRKFEETEDYLERINGFTVNIKRLYPEGGTNAKYPALYNRDTQTMSFNVLTGSNFPKELLAALIAHEIGHQWFDHDEFELDGFLGFLQYKVKWMNPKPSFIYRVYLWFYNNF
jgi:hypothetical protein